MGPWSRPMLAGRRRARASHCRALAGHYRAAHITAMEQSITVNGSVHAWAPGDTVGSLLATLGLDRRKVAVERNAAIVPRSTYDNTGLAPADQIEVVHFIGGG